HTPKGYLVRTGLQTGGGQREVRFGGIFLRRRRQSHAWADGTGFVLELIGDTLELLRQVERKDYPPRCGGDFPDGAIASRNAQDGNILNELRRPGFGQLLLHLRGEFQEGISQP